MPTYDFECEKCAYYTEIFQPHDAPSVHVCPHCGKNELVKVFISPPNFFVRGDPGTVQHLADRNTQNMGHYELQDKQAADNINNPKEQERRKVRQEQRKINKMTPQQKLNWIKNGD